MGKAGDKSPTPDIFKTLFGNLTEEGVSLFYNNPFRKKAEMHDADQLKSDTERHGSLHRRKRRLNDEDYKNLEQMENKIKAESENDVDGSNNTDENKKEKKKKNKKEKKNKKKLRGVSTEEQVNVDCPAGNGVESSQKSLVEDDKNGDLRKDRKRKEAAVEELVQTKKKQKKKKVSLEENQQFTQEIDADEFRETSAADLRKRSFEEDSGDEPNKKIKISHPKSLVRIGRNDDCEIGNGVAVSNGEQADTSHKSALRKRKRHSIEEDYEVTHDMEIDDTPVQGGGVSKKTIGKRKRDDDRADMVITEASFDDEKKLQRTIFVGNLPLRVKKKALIREFSQFGDVESIRLRSVPILDSKLPRKVAILRGKFNDSVNSVHAYIVFKDEESVKAALSHNMVEFGGHHIRVDRAQPPSKKLKGENNPIYDNKRTVFIGNLPFDVKDEELYQMFIGFKPFAPNVEAVRVIRDFQTSMGKGIAYVLFKTVDAAKLAVKKNQFKLRDRNLRLCRAQSRTTPRVLSDITSKPSGLCGKRRAESEPMLNGLSRKKAKCNPSYQGTRASKTGGHLGKGTSSTSINKEGMNFNKSYIPHNNNSKPRKFKRPAVAARRSGLAQSSVQNIAGKKRKLEVDARTGHSKSPKKAKAYRR